jgi:uncharacterized membrane protein
VLRSLLGGALLFIGLRKRSLFGMLLAAGGGALLRRGLRGSMSRSLAAPQPEQPVRFEPQRYGNVELVPDGVLASVASGA